MNTRPRVRAVAAATSLVVTAALVSIVFLVFLVGGGVLQAQDAQRRKGFSISITQPVNQEIVLGKTKITAEVKIDDEELLIMNESDIMGVLEG